MVMDMGLHAIPTLVEPQQIRQVLTPGVEERARHLPPLTSSGRLMPGAASGTPLTCLASTGLVCYKQRPMCFLMGLHKRTIAGMSLMVHVHNLLVKQCCVPLLRALAAT